MICHIYVEENDVKIRTHKNARYATIDDVGKIGNIEFQTFFLAVF